MQTIKQRQALSIAEQVASFIERGGQIKKVENGFITQRNPTMTALNEATWRVRQNADQELVSQ